MIHQTCFLCIPSMYEYIVHLSDYFQMHWFHYHLIFLIFFTKSWERGILLFLSWGVKFLNTSLPSVVRNNKMHAKIHRAQAYRTHLNTSDVYACIFLHRYRTRMSPHVVIVNIIGFIIFTTIITTVVVVSNIIFELDQIQYRNAVERKRHICILRYARTAYRLLQLYFLTVTVVLKFFCFFFPRPLLLVCRWRYVCTSLRWLATPSNAIL